MPGSRRCQVKRNRRTDEPARPPSRLAYVRDKYLAENVAFGLRVPRRPALPVARPVDRQGRRRGCRRARSDRSQRPGLRQPAPRALRRDGVRRAARSTSPRRSTGCVTSRRTLSFPTLFPIEVRVSAADDIPLSTGYGRENGWVAVHQYRGAPYEAYFQGVEAIMDDYGGRPHWGKLHFQTAATLRERYPEWDAFAASAGAARPRRARSATTTSIACSGPIRPDRDRCRRTSCAKSAVERQATPRMMYRRLLVGSVG